MTTPGNYHQIYQAAAADPEQFWLDAAAAIDWVTPRPAHSTHRRRRSIGGSRTPNSTPVTTPWIGTWTPETATGRH